MKKERYFRDELRKLFIGYAIIPSVLFTLVCGLVFLAALMQGKMSGNERHNQYVAGELNRVLTAYGNELEELAAQPELFSGEMNTDRQVYIFRDFYSVSNELGYEADLFVLVQTGIRSCPAALRCRSISKWIPAWTGAFLHPWKRGRALLRSA